jgi:hypothetical protein
MLRLHLPMRGLAVAMVLTFTSALGAGAVPPVQGQNDEAASGRIVAHAVVNLAELARAEQAAPVTPATPSIAPWMPGPLRAGTAPVAPAATALPGLLPQPNSPPASASFPALDDNNGSIPPDTHGAVGPNHLMVTLNTQVRIQDRAGVALSTVSLNSFWSAVNGSSGTFDPKVLYDPYGGRWMFVACDDARAASSGMLIGVSQTSDPTGLWNLYKLDVDLTNTYWADYPSLGFNKDWIALNFNMFANTGSSFLESRTVVFNKSDLYGGSGSPNFTVFTHDALAFTVVPAITYDASLGTLYLLEQLFTFTGDTLRLYAVSGAVNSPTLSAPVDVTVTTNLWNVSPGNADFAPQLGSAQKIQNNDARLQNVVYRNGSLWTTHTVFRPTGLSTRSAVQWWQLSTAGAVLQRGSVEDTGGTNFFAFPSLAVNAFNDVLLGYSRYSANQYASANYSFRSSTDAANTMQADTVLKAGEAPYYKVFSGTRNRWGDYSSTVVDPVNDLDMWTIQEYAATASGGFDRWGTWWGRVSSTLIYRTYLPLIIKN